DEHRSWEVSVDASNHLDGEPRLARAGGARKRHDRQVVAAQELEDLAQLAFAADERRRPRAQRRWMSWRRRQNRREVESWILIEDGSLEPAELRSRLDGEGLDEHASRIAICGQGIGLSAAPIQRDHELTAKALHERVPPDEVLELGYELGMVAEGELGLG